MVKVELKDVTKFYGKIRGVENINLSISDGEYLAVLGATGAGKTTTMYLLAGLLSPSSGTIYFDQEDITKKPAEDRDIGFVFEEYNLFPRMLVEDNVLFGPIVKDLDNYCGINKIILSDQDRGKKLLLESDPPHPGRNDFLKKIFLHSLSTSFE